ncbi:hypothetical protein [Serratia marcescens]|uniref:hypothetical protein n=1 Tax=Serratia marcescens TaxID=615 RepID=UPI0012B66241|nr:hypothetical protein [Serratia marcescens]
MAIYTDNPTTGGNQSLCSMQPSFSEVFTASLSSGWHDSALVSYFRNSKLDGIAAKSSSEFVDESIAGQAFMHYGLGHVNIPEHGIKKDVFNAIIDDGISQIYNEQILCGVVDGTPMSYLSTTTGFISSPVTLVTIILIALLFLRIRRMKMTF